MSLSSHHSNPHFHHFFRNKEMNELYLSYGIMNFAAGLISIYVPIYLYNIGFSIPTIMFLFILSAVSFLIFSIPNARLVAKIGIKKSMLISLPLLVIYYLGLKYVANYHYLIFLLQCLIGFRNTLFNYSFHLNFIKHSDRHNRGKEVSMIQSSALIASLLSPLCGGLIVQYSNYSTLFFSGSFLLLLAMVPLFFSSEIYEKIYFSGRGIFKNIFKKQNLPLTLSFSGYAIEEWIGVTLWPIFLFLLLGKMDSIGMVTSITASLTFLLFYFIGQASDKRDKKKLLKIGTFFYFFGWLGRIFVSGFSSILFVDTYKNLTWQMVNVPWTAYAYDLASRGDYFKFIVQREIIYNISRIFIVPFLILFFYIDFYPFLIAFMVASFFCIFYPRLSVQEEII
jgi:MFS family permease